MAGTPASRRDRTRLPATERRPQIIEAATELIAEQGFWGLSMQDVADRCGLTVPGILRHFGSKDGLLVALLEHRDAEDARTLAREIGIPDDDEPGRHWLEHLTLRQLCAAAVRRNARCPEVVRLFAVLQAESLAPHHPAHEYFAKRQRRLIGAYALAAAKSTAEPLLLARNAAALMDGLQILWLRAPDEIDLVTEWEAMSERLFAGLDTEPLDAGHEPLTTRHGS